MTDTQLYLGIGIPIVAIITSLIISLIQISGIRDAGRELRKEFADLRKEFAELRRDINASISEIRKEAREDRMIIASDIKLLTGKVCELMGQK